MVHSLELHMHFKILIPLKSHIYRVSAGFERSLL